MEPAALEKSPLASSATAAIPRWHGSLVPAFNKRQQCNRIVTVTDCAKRRPDIRVNISKYSVSSQRKQRLNRRGGMLQSGCIATGCRIL
jgi:hypothetical protein